LLAALLISDIHFIRHTRLRTDVDAELRNGLIRFLPHIKARFPDLSLVLVCGDVAYHALDHEYAAAAGFLREVQAALGITRILVVPGNHDVDRSQTISADQRHWRSTPRKSDLDEDERNTALVALMEHDRSGPGLFEPLEAYNRFAAAYGCAVSVEDAFWQMELPINHRYRARIRGLTSVLISDEHDQRDRLLLGDWQVTDLETGPGTVNVTLCHHPYLWLLDGVRQQARLRRRSTLHVTGHEHAHAVTVDPDRATIHLCAGALQPTRNPDWDPRLYAVGLDVIESDGAATAVVEVFCARWHRTQDEFREDHDERYSSPVEFAPPDVVVVEEPAGNIARLVERIAGLQPADRFTVASAIGGDLSELASKPSHQFPPLLVDYAREGDLLRQLWDEVQHMHGDQAGESNPFEESA